jgi:Tol biopolymer transport system component
MVKTSRATARPNIEMRNESCAPEEYFKGGHVPRTRTPKLILALGIFVTTSCSHGTDSTGPNAVPLKPTGTVPGPTIPTPGIASELDFTVQPAAAFAGMPINPAVQVTVRDSHGATATTTPVSVTIALAPGAAGALHGTLMAVSVNGVATFSDLAPTVSGPYRLVATAGGLRADTSATFGVEILSASDRIAFVASGQSRLVDVPSSVMVMNVDGSGLRTIYAGGVLGHPRWSPDGLKLVFSGQSAARPPSTPCWWNDVTCQLKIFVANADGSGGLTHLTDSLSWNSTDPEWSPDGSRIAFTYRFDEIDDAYSIEVMNADGSGKSQVAYPSNWQTDVYMAPTWSPDGRSLAFQFLSFASNGAEMSQILIKDLPGSRLRTLVPAFATVFQWSASGASGPEWSPDGSRLLFRNDRGLALATLDGSAITQLTADLTDGTPSWTPRGRILFTRVVGGLSRIHIMNADGSGVAMLPQPAGNNYWPSWAPARATGAASTNGVVPSF